MRFAHLSDLHLGKRVHEFSMLEEQQFILEQILSLLDRSAVDAVLLAGDLYDKPVPPAEAVRMLDWFLTELAGRGLSVFAVSGNHDSADRVAFGAQLLAGSRVYVSPVFSGAPTPITLKDPFGPLDVYLLPFLKPAAVRHIWPEESIESYNDALAAVLRRCAPDPARRSVMVAHQFVAGASACESEEPSVGGIDCVDASLFDAFDYVALGHLHSPQKVGRDTLRYCGTPLKYSFSEAGQQKSITLVDFGPKGQVELSTVPLTPRRELRQLRGTYMELTDRRFYADTATDDYLHITLTDEQDVPEALARLRVIYPNLMRLDYDNRRTREQHSVEAPTLAAQFSMTPLEHFSAFYQLQNNQSLTPQQTRFCQELIEQIWKEGEDA
ncbi:MAG: exonuclease SbcCD subunit D [Faecalibacterium sp.]